MTKSFKSILKSAEQMYKDSPNDIQVLESIKTFILNECYKSLGEYATGTIEVISSNDGTISVSYDNEFYNNFKEIM